MRISYSQIEWFLRCPYLYKYQFIDKHKLSKGKDAVFGSLLHDAMEHIYASRPAYPTFSEALVFFEKEWEHKEAPSFFSSELDAQVHFKEGLRIIKDYYAKADFESTNTIAIEKFFEVPIEDPKTNEVHLLTGRIDRIDKTKEGIEVIDYKTNKSLKSKRQVAQDLQLSLYHLGFVSLWPDLANEYDIHVSLYFLRHNEKISVQKKQAELETTRAKLIEYIQQIKIAVEKNSFPPKPSLLCQMEPYGRVCPYFKDRYRENKPRIASEEVNDVIKEYSALKAQERSVKNRIVELNAMIQAYLDEQGLEGIFNDTTGIVRSQLPRYELKKEAIKLILEPLGRWLDVLEISQAKLKIIRNEIPEEYQKKIVQAQELKSITKILRMKKL